MFAYFQMLKTIKGRLYQSINTASKDPHSHDRDKIMALLTPRLADRMIFDENN